MQYSDNALAIGTKTADTGALFYGSVKGRVKVQKKV